MGKARQVAAIDLWSTPIRCSKGGQTMKGFRQFAVALGALVLASGPASAQTKVAVAIGGAGCLCYLPTVLAEQLGEYKKAGLDVELINFRDQQHQGSCRQKSRGERTGVLNGFLPQVHPEQEWH
jgi:hypothetical protein